MGQPQWEIQVTGRNQTTHNVTKYRDSYLLLNPFVDTICYTENVTMCNEQFFVYYIVENMA